MDTSGTEEPKATYTIEKNTEGWGWVPIAQGDDLKSVIATARRIQYGDAEGEIISLFRVVDSSGEVLWGE